jgi:hypothetical protein
VELPEDCRAINNLIVLWDNMLALENYQSLWQMEKEVSAWYNGFVKAQ